MTQWFNKKKTKQTKNSIKNEQMQVFFLKTLKHCEWSYENS